MSGRCELFLALGLSNTSDVIGQNRMPADQDVFCASLRSRYQHAYAPDRDLWIVSGDDA